ncbi:MAG TPA: molybdopterin cofactor-binding domain-containing protein, partial [Bacillota bacterium]
LLEYTSTGLVVRAGTRDPEVVQVLGLDLNRARSLVFVVGVVMAGLGGALSAPLRGVIPEMGEIVLPQSFVVVVIGGMGSYWGTELGQGVRKAVAQILADHTGVPLDQVKVVVGDTERAMYGGGSWASRGVTAGGSAALLAARMLADKIRRIAADMLEVAPDDVELAEGEARVVGAPQQAVPFRTIARKAYFMAGDLPEGMEPGLELASHWEPEIPATFANGAHVAAVEIDPVTGALRVLKWVAVEDAGTILNPALMDGQLRGAIAQGLGGAIYEHMIYDADGQLLTDNFMNYLLPTAMEVPHVEIHHLETPSTRNPLGSKGMAESGTSASPGLLANAVADALGVEVNELPLHPARIVDWLEKSPYRRAT